MFLNHDSLQYSGLPIKTKEGVDNVRNVCSAKNDDLCKRS